MFIHYLAILAQICYTIYNFLTWHMRMGIRWVKANWKNRERFLESYRPSTEEERDYEHERKNHAAVFRYGLKAAMLAPRRRADEDDPVWGEINKKYNVDNKL